MLNLPTTMILLDRFQVDARLRRICGWERRAQVPSEATFSRAFAEFAASGLLDAVHAALIQSGYRAANAARARKVLALPPNLARVNAAARRAVQTRFTALLHHVDECAVERVFRRQRRRASAGVNGMTVAAYEQDLEANLRGLCKRLHTGRYRPQPVRRVYIPKADGRQRPLGVPSLEGKIVQGAVAEALSAVYEADFLGFSYGFRPGRNPHMAVDALHTALMSQRVTWVLDADVASDILRPSPSWGSPTTVDGRGTAGSS
jgi:hypothetical protein